MTRSIEHVIAELEGEKTFLEGALAGWSDKFNRNPLYELSWSITVFEHAARLKVTAEILAFLKGDVNPTYEGDRLTAARDELLRNVVRAARTRESSTSPTANLARDSERVARAEMLERLGYRAP